MMTNVGYLPEETSSFVGRRAELARLHTALTTRRMTTLIGPGGVGKTRLALRAARAVADRYADGAWWADLSPLSGDQLLLPTVSDAVGLADHTLRMPVEALCEWLADKHLLLVLDSAEHLRGPCSHLLAEILTTSPALTVLVTSRQPLGTRGEHVVEVPPLPVDGAPDALQLFADRLRAADPRGPASTLPGTRRPPPRSAAASKASLLAIELAAAGIGRHSVAQLATRIGTPLRRPGPHRRRVRGARLSGAAGLPGGAGAAADPGTSRLDLLADETAWPRRHRTLRTAIGWSHELCTPLERLLWARLTPLRTEFDAEVAREVCAGGPLTPGEVDRALQGLVAQSVVQRDGDRYRMLDTLREYGRMWLAELGEARAAADRHAHSFLGLARRAHEGWTGPDQVSWYHTVSDTHLDLCAALEHLLAHDAEGAQEMAGRVGFFWACCGHLSEARNYAQRALDAGPVEGPHRTRLQWVLGVAALLQSDFATAEKYGALCTATALYDGDDEGMLAATYLSGITQLMTGEPEAALEAARARAADDGGRPRGLRPPAALPPRHRLRAHRTRPARRVRGGGDRAAPGLRTRRRVLDPLLRGLPARPDRPAPGPPGGLRHVRPGDARRQTPAPRQLRHRPGPGPPGRRHRRPGRGRPGRPGLRHRHAYWRMVGHPQRGTPELGPVRERCELQARAAVGDEAYQRAFERGQSDNAEVGLAAALRTELQL